MKNVIHRTRLTKSWKLVKRLFPGLPWKGFDRYLFFPDGILRPSLLIISCLFESWHLRTFELVLKALVWAISTTSKFWRLVGLAICVSHLTLSHSPFILIDNV